MRQIGWLYWDPPREAFTMPLIDRPVMWYGVFFVSGFILGYFILLPMFRRLFRHRGEAAAKELSVFYADRVTWFIVVGTVVGARLGHILFYDLSYYLDHPDKIFKTWEGGLASHGGTIGVLLSLYLFLRWYRKQLPELTFISLIDIIVVPTALVACFIRIGNLFNQEVLGYPSTVPWAIIFGHGVDDAAAVPRHPAQLYEAAAYLGTFILLYSLWKYRGQTLKVGTLTGLFFICIFGSRFLIEFLKLPESIDHSFFHMGQYLSLPFILLGVLLLIIPRRKDVSVI